MAEPRTRNRGNNRILGDKEDEAGIDMIGSGTVLSNPESNAASNLRTAAETPALVAEGARYVPGVKNLNMLQKGRFGGGSLLALEGINQGVQFLPGMEGKTLYEAASGDLAGVLTPDLSVISDPSSAPSRLDSLSNLPYNAYTGIPGKTLEQPSPVSQDEELRKRVLNAQSKEMQARAAEFEGLSMDEISKRMPMISSSVLDRGTGRTAQQAATQNLGADSSALQVATSQGQAIKDIQGFINGQAAFRDGTTGQPTAAELEQFNINKAREGEVVSAQDRAAKKVQEQEAAMTDEERESMREASILRGLQSPFAQQFFAEQQQQREAAEKQKKASREEREKRMQEAEEEKQRQRENPGLKKGRDFTDSQLRDFFGGGDALKAARAKDKAGINPFTDRRKDDEQSERDVFARQNASDAQFQTAQANATSRATSIPGFDSFTPEQQNQIINSLTDAQLDMGAEDLELPKEDKFESGVNSDTKIIQVQSEQEYRDLLNSGEYDNLGEGFSVQIKGNANVFPHFAR